MVDGQSRQYPDIFESTVQGTGRMYGKTGKTLGAALKYIFRLLEQINDLLFFYHQYWESNLRPYKCKTSLFKCLNFCGEKLKKSGFKLLYKEGNHHNFSE